MIFSIKKPLKVNFIKLIILCLLNITKQIKNIMKKLSTIFAVTIALFLFSCNTQEEVTVNEGQLYGFLEKSVSQNERGLPRRRVGGAGVSVRRLGNSNRALGSFSANKSSELSYQLTDANGEFSLEGIPSGNYVVVFEYEGLATSPDSNNAITITDAADQRISIEGLVENDLIFIETFVE